MPEHRCYVCGGSDLRLKHSIEQPPGRRGDFELCACGVLNFFAQSAGDPYEDDYYGEGSAKIQGSAGKIRAWSARDRARRAHQFAGKAGSCLDIGCGDGDFLWGLQQLGWDVSGSELPGPACQRASARLPGRISSDPDFGNAPSAAYDLISLWQVFEHLPHPQALLRNVHRMLKPGGSLIIAVPNPASWQARLGGGSWLHLDPPRHLHLASPARLRSLLKEQGFQTIQQGNPWLEFGVIGVVGTASNELGRPRDELLDGLRSGWRNFSSAKRIFCLLSLAVSGIPATAFAALEALCGFPATYEIWARRTNADGASCASPEDISARWPQS